jgi:hypothetical protein
MATQQQGPLNWNVPIVDKSGLPTPEFMRKWLLQISTNGSIPFASGTGIFVQTSSNTWVVRLLAAGTGLTVTNASGVAGNPTFSLADTAVTPGTYGDSTHVGQFTVDQQGRLTFAQNVAITYPASATDISPFSDNSITKPTAASFSIADDAGAGHGTGSKVDLATRGVEFTITCGTNGSTQSLFSQAAVSNTLGAVTAYIAPNFQRDNLNWGIGVGVRDNAGKVHAFGIRNASPTAYVDMRYTNMSTVATLTTLNGGQIVAGRPIWLKLAKVSTNFVFSVSFDGEKFFTVSTVSATVFVGATLNDVGIFSFFNGASGDTINIDCFSFLRT